MFSVWPTIVEILKLIFNDGLIGLSTIGAYGSQNGYTIVNFLLMYLIGAGLRLYGEEIINSFRIRNLIISLLINILLINIFINIELKFFNNMNISCSYCNPLIIIEAVIVFAIFAKIEIGYKKYINAFAKSVFTFYLLHTYFIQYIGIQKFVSGNTFIMVLHIIASYYSGSVVKTKI